MSSAAVLRVDRAGQAADRRFVRHVELDELGLPLVTANRLGHPLAIRRVAVRDIDERPLARQRVGDRLTNSRARAGHQRGLVVESEHGE